MDENSPPSPTPVFEDAIIAITSPSAYTPASKASTPASSIAPISPVFSTTFNAAPSCSGCGATFASPAALLRHTCASVAPMRRSPARASRLRCATCGARFKTARMKRLHERLLHEDEKVERCNYCSRGFGDVASLNAHVLELHQLGKRRYQHVCGECVGVGFGTAVQLEKHVQGHRRKRGRKEGLAGAENFRGGANAGR